MYAVMGVTGKVGGAVARSLLAAGHPVRAIVRDRSKGLVWSERGCEVAVADIHDVHQLSAAFAGTRGAFVLVPPRFDPLPGFPEAIATGLTLRMALNTAGPDRVVYLSTIGAQANRNNLLTQHTIIEQSLRRLTMPVTYLRPAWFLENAAWDVAPARESGVIPSYLQPLHQPFPMVSAVDVGRVSAELLLEQWIGQRVVELEGPARVSPNQIAASFGQLLGRPVRMDSVPRDSWEHRFRSQGMKYPGPRIAMLDGFNQGWIELERRDLALKGRVGLEEVLRSLLDQERRVA